MIKNDLLESPLIDKGWKQYGVCDLYTIVGGGTPATSNKDYWEGDIPWISSADIYGLTNITPRRFINQTAIKNSATKLVPSGSIIVVTRVGLGKIALAPYPLCFSQDSHALIPKSDLVDQRFALYFLSVAVQSFKHQSRGSTIEGVTKKQLSEIIISLPPIEEQRRIALKIEMLLQQIEDARKSLDRLPQIMRSYRQSVLAAAFRGELTERIPGDEPASVLLERIRAERRRKWEESLRTKGKDPAKTVYEEPASPDTENLPELPEGWAWTTIGNVTECLDRMRVPVNKKQRKEGAIPYYGANGQVGWIDEFLFDEPLILVVEDESFVGREKPFSYKIEGKTWVNNHAHVLRPKPQIDIDFLNYSLMYYPFIPLTSGTTGRRKLTQEALMNAPYAIAPVEEQKRIVHKIRSIFDKLPLIEKAVDLSSRRLEELEQAALAKAFRGEL